MPATQVVYRPTPSDLPISTPMKSPYYAVPVQKSGCSRVPVALPSPGSSVRTSAVPSLTSSSYAGSAPGEQEGSTVGTGSVDLIDMMTDRLSNAIDPLPLDRSLARQAQT